MFLLFLIGLGTAHVNAQVRIGGNSAPNGSAILDLNATDAATGTKGLALPRVSLTTDSMQLKTGVANLDGMMVYNTSNTIGLRGVYVWMANWTKWVQASLPVSAIADSATFLMSTGKGWTASWGSPVNYNADTLTLKPTFPAVTWSLIIDTTLTLPRLGYPAALRYYTPGILVKDVCVNNYGRALTVLTWADVIVAVPVAHHPLVTAETIRVRCFRPSI